jgi:TPR repeat protein
LLLADEGNLASATEWFRQAKSLGHPRARTALTRAAAKNRTPRRAAHEDLDIDPVHGRERR